MFDVMYHMLTYDEFLLDSLDDFITLRTKKKFCTKVKHLDEVIFMSLNVKIFVALVYQIAK